MIPEIVLIRQLPLFAYDFDLKRLFLIVGRSDIAAECFFQLRKGLSSASFDSLLNFYVDSNLESYAAFYTFFIFFFLFFSKIGMFESNLNFKLC